jgi:hypothetical protein
MINVFRTYRPLRFVLVATLLLSIVLPVVQMVCSLDGDVVAQEREEAITSGWDIAQISGCHQLSDLFPSSTHDVDRCCQREATTSSVQTCEARPLEVAKMLPAQVTEELFQLLAAQLSFLLELSQGYLSVALTVAPFSRTADLQVPQPFVSLRVLFSSFLI